MHSDTDLLRETDFLSARRCTCRSTCNYYDMHIISSSQLDCVSYSVAAKCGSCTDGRRRHSIKATTIQSAAVAELVVTSLGHFFPWRMYWAMTFAQNWRKVGDLEYLARRCECLYRRVALAPGTRPSTSVSEIGKFDFFLPSLL